MDNSLLFATLFRKYLDNNCSPAEVDQLMDFLKDEAYKQQADELIDRQLAVQRDTIRPVDRALNDRLSLRLQTILETETPAMPQEPTHFLRRNSKWLAAAAVLLLLGAGTFMWMSRPAIPPKPAVVQAQPKAPIQNDVLPGGNKAMLTLGNGATIILDSAHTGALAQQGNTQVIKQDDGQLLYDQTDKNSGNSITTDHSPLTYNTLTTPRGGQYQLVLPDGSTVWLNAASSIRFPTAFTGNERDVEITGEAYFEVKKNAAMPFKVKMNNGASVKVLGTHFNINAYEDEAASKVTLLEGIVEVVNGQWSMANGKTAILKPGEQAAVKENAPFTINHSPDLEEVMAWKNGAFQFNGSTIETVMRQISRWYNVEVEYKGKISLHFAGAISRNVNISQVLEMLEKAGGIKTSISGNKVIVAP